MRDNKLKDVWIKVIGRRRQASWNLVLAIELRKLLSSGGGHERDHAVFNRLARMAAALFEAPIGLIGIPFAGRLYFEGRHGIDVADVPIDVIGFKGDGPFVLDDSHITELQLLLSAAGVPTINFVTCVPLRQGSGDLQALICVFDHRARRATPAQLKAFEDIGHLVRAAIETVGLRHRAHALDGDVKALMTLGSDVVWQSDPALRLTFGHFRDQPDLQGHLAIILKLFEGIEDIAGLCRLTNDHPGAVQMADYLANRQPFRRLPVAVPSPRRPLRWFEVSGQPFFSPAGEFLGFRGLLAEVTGQKRQLDLMLQLSETDVLTGLLNRQAGRRLLEARIAEDGGRGNPLALLVLDIDEFRTINISIGQDGGDDVLREVAHRLTALKTSGHDVARVGSDEFALLVRGSDARPERMPLVVEAVGAALTRPFKAGDRDVHLRASIGIAYYPGDGEDPLLLAQNAFLALEFSRRGGMRRGGVTFFQPQFAERAAKNKLIEADIRRGIDAGEFCVFLQPIVSTTDLTVLGFEALLRWRHPDQGLLAPGAFLDVAAASGLTVPLGQIALRSAAETLGFWRRAGLNVGFIAVNVAMAQFLASDLVDDLVSAAEDNGIEPHHLKIEVTEQVFLSETSAADVGNVLTALRALGVSIDLDDFGTGYASLVHLRHFPITGIKIDRSFTNGLPDDPDDGEIVMALITLARNLNLSVVAEGVETESQRAFLERQGCAAIQGYLVARPMPLAEATDFLAERQTVGESRLA